MVLRGAEWALFVINNIENNKKGNFFYAQKRGAIAPLAPPWIHPLTFREKSRTNAADILITILPTNQHRVMCQIGNKCLCCVRS